MPQPPTPRFTSISDLQAYLSVSGGSTDKQTVLPWILAGAEAMVERYCRRHFAPEPALADPRTGFQRQVIEVSGQGQTAVPNVAGTFTLAFGGSSPTTLTLPVTAAQLQTALLALVGAGNLTCSGGPLPSYPISVTFAGTLTGSQPTLVADSTGLGSAGFVVVVNAGFDSAPPVVKRFSTRGKTTVRMPDLRLVDSAQDPRVPGSGGIVLYGRKLLPNQYYLGYGAYAPGGADEAIGQGDYAEPCTEIVLGYGYGTGFSIAQQFQFVLPLIFLSNDLSITGRWGWNPTPPAIVNATYAVAARLYRERDAAFSDQLVTQEGVVWSYFKSLPASIKAVLDTYRTPNLSLV